MNRILLGTIIQPEYKVIYAENGKEALEKIHSNGPAISLVLLDLLMLYSVPVMEKGGAVLQVPSVEFSVNKNSKNLKMANEFMRFLLRTEELNNLAKIKRLITCSTVYAFDDVYAPLEKSEHLYQLEIGIMDNAYSQLRNAAIVAIIYTNLLNCFSKSFFQHFNFYSPF